jgi:hypothetical protein
MMSTVRAHTGAWSSPPKPSSHKDNRMRPLLSLPLAACLAFLTASLGAQQNVGINLFRGAVTLSGVLCGFNCNSATNTGQAVAAVNDTIGIRLLGQSTWPAAVLLGAGSVAPCPGLVLPGVGNALLVDPNTLVVLAATGAMTGAARANCGETANQVMFTVTLPLVRPGTMVHFQGLVFDNTQPAFTRPVVLTIN